MPAARRGCPYPLRWRLLLAAVATLVPVAGDNPARAQDVVIEVAPGGRDRLPAKAVVQDGSRLDIVRSLDEALAKARGIRRARGDRQPAITIVLSPGLHRLEQAVRLGAEDSGTPDAPLRIRGAADGSTVLTGSLPLSPERLPVSGYRTLPNAVRPHVRLYRLPARMAAWPHIDTPQAQGSSVLVERFQPPATPSVPFEVFDAGGALRPARWPNTGWAAATEATADGWWGIATDAPRVEAWRGEPDLWAVGYWRWDYAYERHLVREVARGAGNGNDRDALYFTTPLSMGLKRGARYRIQHALAELDAPGEWYRDHAANLLIAWPRPGAERLEVSVAENAVLLQNASHVRISDLTIERFVGDGIRVIGGRDVVVDNSTLRWTGLRAAAFIGGRDNGITASDLSDAGEGGVLLAGGDRATLTPAGLFARSCRIQRFARLGLTFRPAIDMTGVGNVAAGNYIADAPNFGIQFQGNDHLIEDNEIADVVNDTSDAGALYTGHDWTARGTVVRRNFLHDIVGRQAGFEVKGVYLDDLASGVTVQDNLFLRVEQPVFVGGGRDNTVEGNVFIAAHPAIHIDARGLDWASPSVTDAASALRRRLAEVPVDSAIWRQRYPPLAGLLGDEPGAAKRNRTRGNIIVTGETYRFATRADAGKQFLGPDHGSDHGPDGQANSLSAEILAALATATSAREVAALLAPALDVFRPHAAAVAAMDRRTTAGRRVLVPKP